MTTTMKESSAVGSEIKSRVLTEDDVREIRLLYCPFIVTQQKLADRFGVSRGNIQDIINRETWTHVD